jgi:ectoine hydroxylase-related dioxygenase (phytanoyl-CoA dioxygenase family)
MNGVAADRWLEATSARAGDSPLHSEQIASWREAGWALVSGIFDAALINALRHAAAERFPAPGTAAAGETADFGSDLVFPSNIPELNALTLHPRLLSAVASLLDRPISDLRLSQSDLWPKYGRKEKSAGALDNMDQRIHVDYPNHTLAHPAEWHRPEAVEMIVYLSDVDACGGPTAVVPREGADDPAYRWPIVDSPGIADLDYVNDKAQAEAYFATERPALADWRARLYERERYAAFKPGDVLFYRHDTWHRGTPMKSDTLRLVQNITFRRADCEWISTLHVGWAWKAYRRNKFLERLIAGSSLEQRAVLGFPQPDSDYWTDATIAAVEARHGVFGMDMTPYREALAARRP